MGNSAIYFQAADYSTAQDKLMGRNAASEQFLKAWVQYSGQSEIHAMVRNESEAKAFEKTFQGFRQKSEQKGLVHHPMNLGPLSKVGGLYLPDPNLHQFAHLRSRMSNSAYSLVGVTHTLASAPTLKMISEYVTAPLYAWDALICTSKVVQDSVQRIFEETQHFLSERFHQDLKVDLPQTPIIPLGTELDEELYQKRSEIKTRWRKELQIDEDAVVFLFYGRLSFHAKANPFAMYRSLQETAKQSGKKVVLIQAGWFANEGIAQAMKVSAQEWAPDVDHLFLDGRLPKVREELRYACDVFISLSDNIQETFGLTPIEAMASGLPVVVSDWNGYRDTVHHGEDGFRIETTVPKSKGALMPFTMAYESRLDTYDHYIGKVSHSTAVDIPKCIQACCDLVDSPELRFKMGEKARQHIQSTFTWEKVIQQYVELFDELAAIRKARHDKNLRVHPVHFTPYEMFEEYPSRFLDENSSLSLASDLELSLKELDRVYANPMFNYAGLDKPELLQTLLKAFDQEGCMRLNQVMPDLPAHVKERAACFLLKVGILKKV